MANGWDSMTFVCFENAKNQLKALNRWSHMKKWSTLSYLKKEKHFRSVKVIIIKIRKV